MTPSHPVRIVRDVLQRLTDGDVALVGHFRETGPQVDFHDGPEETFVAYFNRACFVLELGDDRELVSHEELGRLTGDPEPTPWTRRTDETPP